MSEFAVKHSIGFENNSDVYITKSFFAPLESNFGVIAATSSGVVHVSDSTHFEPLVRIQSGFPDISDVCAFGSSVWLTSENSKQILEFDCRSLRGKATQQNAVARFDAHDKVGACAVGGATSGDAVLICGCEGGNLQWFDRRSRHTVVLEDIHSEAVSQIQFVRGSNTAYSGGLDGLICEIDTSIGDEDALSATVDAEGGAVQHLALGGKQQNSLSCVSHNERFSLFRRATMTPLVTLSDPRKALENLAARSIDYTVASLYSSQIEKLLILCGNSDGELCLSSLDISNQAEINSSWLERIDADPQFGNQTEETGSHFQPLYQLNGGHNATVRSFDMHSNTGSIVTGGEDASNRVIIWSLGAVGSSSSSSSTSITTSTTSTTTSSSNTSTSSANTQRSKRAANANARTSPY